MNLVSLEGHQTGTSQSYKENCCPEVRHKIQPMALTFEILFIHYANYNIC